MIQRIAMWSGPRSVSTAMMRAWENRPDTLVIDEPFYAHYLARTGVNHPGRDDVIAAGETRWQTVARRLGESAPDDGMSIQFQKHMAHHLPPDLPADWLAPMRHFLLIRDPDHVITSFTAHQPLRDLDELGLVQQLRIFEQLERATGSKPPVIDAADVCNAPEATLRALCEALGVSFDARMLAWPAGPRPSDGPWAKYWYRSVLDSTGFRPYARRHVDLPAELRSLAAEARVIYRGLHTHRLRGQSHS